MHWNRTERFVLKSIGETQVLVKTEAVERIQTLFRELNDELNYEPPVAAGPGED